MWHREGSDLLHGRMSEHSLFDLSRTDFFSTSINQLLDAPGDKEETIVIEISLVPRIEPTISKAVRIGLRIVLVT